MSDSVRTDRERRRGRLRRSILLLVVCAALVQLSAPPRASAATLDITLTPTEDIVLGMIVTRRIQVFESGPYLDPDPTFWIVDDPGSGATFAAGATTTRSVDLGEFTESAMPYIFLGLYDDGAGRGVTVSMPSFTAATAIANMDTWDDLFAPIAEPAVQALLQSIGDGLIESALADQPALFWSTHAGLAGVSLNTPFTSLVNFSDATDGGAITVSLIPEPSTGVMLALGLVGLWFARPRGKTR